MKTTLREQAAVYFFRFGLLYLAGFMVGIIFVNLAYENMAYQWKTLGVYLVQEQESGFSGREYFLELLKSRGVWFAVYAFGGITAFGILLVILGLLWNGFLAGSLLTIFLTEYGIRGMLLGAGCFFPQGLLYVPAAVILYLLAFQMSEKFWKKRTLSGQDYKSYFFLILLCGILLFAGLWLESYVNYFVIKAIKTIF